MGQNKYVCITHIIFEFTLEAGDEFVKYFSYIGNSDVPYPVLLGKNNFLIVSVFPIASFIISENH
jgi:hypothetical protein